MQIPKTRQRLPTATGCGQPPADLSRTARPARHAGCAKWLAVLILALVQAPQAAAHPFHISLAEMEWNRATERLEVSLKLHAVDIERALSQAARHKVNLEKEPHIERLLRDYLQQHFRLVTRSSVAGANQTDAEQLGDQPEAAQPVIQPVIQPVNQPGGDQPGTVHFVGQELDAAWLWLYFEIELPPAARKVSEHEWVLVNSVLLDVTQGQINTVTVRHGGQRHALRMTAKQPWASFSAAWLEPPQPASPPR